MVFYYYIMYHHKVRSSKHPLVNHSTNGQKSSTVTGFSAQAAVKMSAGAWGPLQSSFLLFLEFSSLHLWHKTPHFLSGFEPGTLSDPRGCTQVHGHIFIHFSNKECFLRG